MEVNLMTTLNYITELFCKIDDKMKDVSKHSQSLLYPSEIVTLAFMFAIKGCGNRAFYRWLKGDWIKCFPKLPDRTRLFRLFKNHRKWTERFMAEPTILGVIDSYGIELIHPIREGRSKQQIGKKGISNHRWIVGCKLCLVLNKFGLVVAWGCDTANVHDSKFKFKIEEFEGKMIILGDTGFHSKKGDPDNFKLCPRGTWNDRMVIETVLSMLTVVTHFKRVGHRQWEYFKMRLAFTLSAFNLLTQWDGLKADEYGFVPLSIAEFSL
jgi:hypothetical protein